MQRVDFLQSFFRVVVVFGASAMGLHLEGLRREEGVFNDGDENIENGVDEEHDEGVEVDARHDGVIGVQSVEGVVDGIAVQQGEERHASLVYIGEQL
jgi:hypothetical protein